MQRPFSVLLALAIAASAASGAGLLELLAASRSQVLAQRPASVAVSASERDALLQALAADPLVKAVSSSLKSAGADLSASPPSVSRAFSRTVGAQEVRVANVYYRASLPDGSDLVVRVAASLKAGKAEVLELDYWRGARTSIEEGRLPTLVALSTGERDRLKSLALAHERIKPISLDLLDKSKYAAYIPPYARDGLITLSFVPSDTACPPPLGAAAAAAAAQSRDALCARCACPRNETPVCGEDWLTYANPCLARCAGAPVRYAGHCRTSCGLYGTILVSVDTASWTVKGVSFRESRSQDFGPFIGCGPDEGPRLSAAAAAAVGRSLRVLGELASELERYGSKAHADRLRSEARSLAGAVSVGGECAADRDCAFSACSCSCESAGSAGSCARSCPLVYSCACRDGLCTGDERRCACPDRYEPVCGSDGADYPSACDAACAGVKVARAGACSPGGCTGALPGPVPDSLARLGGVLIDHVASCRGVGGVLAGADATPARMGRDRVEYRVRFEELPDAGSKPRCERGCRERAELGAKECAASCALGASPCAASCSSQAASAASACLSGCAPSAAACDVMCNASSRTDLGAARIATLARGVPLAFMGHELTLASVDQEARAATIQAKTPDGRIVPFTPDYDDASEMPLGPFSVAAAAGLTRLREGSAEVVLFPAAEPCAVRCAAEPPPRYRECMEGWCAASCAAHSDLGSLCEGVCGSPEGWEAQGAAEGCPSQAAFAACLGERCEAACQASLDRQLVCQRTCEAPFEALSASGGYDAARASCAAAQGGLGACLVAKCRESCLASFDVAARCKGSCASPSGLEAYGGLEAGRRACASSNEEHRACMAGRCAESCARRRTKGSLCQERCASPAAWRSTEGYAEQDARCREAERGAFDACAAECGCRVAVARASCVERCAAAGLLEGVRACALRCRATRADGLSSCASACPGSDAAARTSCTASCGSAVEARKRECLAGCQGGPEMCGAAGPSGADVMPPSEQCASRVARLHECSATVRLEVQGAEGCPASDARCGLTRASAAVVAAVSCRATPHDESYLNASFCRRDEDCALQPSCCSCAQPSFANRLAVRPVFCEERCACSAPPDVSGARWVGECSEGRCTARRVELSVACDSDSDCVHAAACCGQGGAACVSRQGQASRDCSGVACAAPAPAPTACVCASHRCVAQAIGSPGAALAYSLFGGRATAGALCGDGACVPGEDRASCPEDCAVGAW